MAKVVEIRPREFHPARCIYCVRMVFQRRGDRAAYSRWMRRFILRARQARLREGERLVF